VEDRICADRPICGPGVPEDECIEASAASAATGDDENVSAGGTATIVIIILILIAVFAVLGFVHQRSESLAKPFDAAMEHRAAAGVVDAEADNPFDKGEFWAIEEAGMEIAPITKYASRRPVPSSPRRKKPKRNPAPKHYEYTEDESNSDDSGSESGEYIVTGEGQEEPVMVLSKPVDSAVSLQSYVQQNEYGQQQPQQPVAYNPAMAPPMMMSPLPVHKHMNDVSQQPAPMDMSVASYLSGGGGVGGIVMSPVEEEDTKL
jgi:hypothetical protein